MKSTTLFPLVLFAISVLAVFSCGDDDGPDYTADADCTQIDVNLNSYTNSIKTILDASCALSGCHDAATKQSGVQLDTYAEAKRAFDKDNALCAIHHGSGCKPMPDNGTQLADDLINKIDCWVKNGYKQ